MLQQYHNLLHHQLHSRMHSGTADSICLQLQGDDDLHYAELERQILELTAHEDDVNLETRCRNSSTSTRKQASKLVSAVAASPGNYFTSWEKENSGFVPPSVSNLWHKSNGTGVFIPHVVLSKKRHAPSAGGGRRRIYKQVENNKKP